MYSKFPHHSFSSRSRGHGCPPSSVASDFIAVHLADSNLALALTPEQCAGLKNLYLKTDWGMVDCLGEVLGVGDFESVLKQSVELELPFGNCRILDLEALVRAKEAMNRDHDRIAVRQFKEIQRRRQQR